MKKLSLFLLVVLFSSHLYSSPLHQRAKDVASFLGEKPTLSMKELFASSFLKIVPESKMQSYFQNIHTKCGSIIKILPMKIYSSNRGIFEFHSSKKFKIKITLVIQNSSPYKITGILFGQPIPFEDSSKKILEEIKKLPGSASMAVTKLKGKNITILYSHNPRKRLAIASAFKLYILGALIQDISRKKYSWAEVVHLQKKLRSYPSGRLHTWPPKAPITIHTLAVQMISISDNTATDHLLFLLGRQRIERFMVYRGNQDPRNVPLFSTSELFKLKFNDDTRYVGEFQKLDTQGKRLYLSHVIRPLPRSVVSSAIEKPRQIAELEWFGSSLDLCREMNWIRLHSLKGPGKKAREILSINPGLPIDRTIWTYIGYKGGSEPGVMNMTYLLRRKDGTWFAMAFTWNNPSAKVDDIKLIQLAMRTLYLLEKFSLSKVGK